MDSFSSSLNTSDCLTFNNLTPDDLGPEAFTVKARKPEREIKIYVSVERGPILTFQAYKLTMGDFNAIFQDRIVYRLDSQDLPWSLCIYDPKTNTASHPFDLLALRILLSLPLNHQVSGFDRLISDEFRDVVAHIKDPVKLSKAVGEFARLSGASQVHAEQIQTSTHDTRDAPSYDSFKNRLVERDRACVICDAAGTDEPFMYSVDYSLLEGAHIIPLQALTLWKAQRLSEFTQDPYTHPDNLRNKQRSMNKHMDDMRMNSLENGVLLCLKHHKLFDRSAFVVRPKTHAIVALHPRCADIDGKVVTKPWAYDKPNIFAPPSDEILVRHFRWVVYAAMKAAAAEDTRPFWDDDDDDDAEFEDESELTSLASNEELADIRKDQILSYLESMPHPGGTDVQVDDYC
ncbi:uncharacterized protein FIBRA_00226 [Fibroporia radiculosa]|uniref:HNH nuclease domain-containing protein n=1 Tax=Fibroporia radiculosa TaxID=599839 RepID=J7RGN5_9APHY|nr:uncharacterized protein FIBRA_00226 [Fibroporia radiculosa]CCL98232.1 predicted protein [Fibroporia radiculosa]